MTARFGLITLLLLFAAARPCVAQAEVQINGPDEFQYEVQAGLDALGTIGLRSYVTSQISTIDSILSPSCAAFNGPQAGQPCLGWTDVPADAYSRAHVHLRWPQATWASPSETAAYLAHEATHVLRYRQVPTDWADERGPTSVEFVVRWELRTLEGR